MARDGVTIQLDEKLSRRRVRYTHIVDAIADAIGAGRLRPSDRLPTHREFAAHNKVSVGTVSRAYAEAERRGLIIGEVGRGTFVCNSAARSAVSRDDAKLIDLTINRPPPEPCAEQLRVALRSLSKAGQLAGLLGHQPSLGLEPHRLAAANVIGGNGLAVKPEQIVICNGVQHGLAVLFAALAQPGDVVLTEELNYPGIKLLAQIYHLNLHGLAMDEQGLRPDALDQACRASSKAKFLFCTPTVQNPTASVMSVKRRQEIASVAERHDLILIEDDIYGLLLPERLPPISALVPSRSFYVTGTSKCLAEGMRIGYVAAPATRVEELAVGLRATTWMGSAIVAEIVSSWLVDGTANRIFDWHRKEAAARQALARAHLGAFDFTGHPVTYHIWLHLPPPWRSEQFVGQARKRGIMITPAETFVVGRAPAPHAVRISLGGSVDRQLLETAFKKLAELLVEKPRFEASSL